MTDQNEVDIPEVFGLDLDLQKQEDADPRNFPYDSVSLGGPLPPAYSVVEGYITNQRKIDSCVGHGCAGAKSEQEKKQLSPRDLWAQCKEAQGYGGYGTSINLAMKKIVDPGVSDYGMLDEDTSVDRVRYMTIEATPEMEARRAQNRGGSFWFIRPSNMEMVKEALMNEGASLPTSLRWYKEYNRPIDGFLPKGETPSQGHCVHFSGWFQKKFEDGWDEVYAFKNSFGEKWGDKGYFYVRRKDMQEKDFGNFYVLVDIERSLADLIVAYGGKMVKTFDSPKVYYIERDIKRHVEDELSFWLYTASELKDVQTIPAQDLAMFKEGKQIKKTDADPTLLRVIQNMGKLYESNPEYAKKLFKF